MTSKRRLQAGEPPFLSTTSPPPPGYDVSLLSAEFQPSVVMSDSSRTTNMIDSNLVPLRRPVTPDEDIPEPPFRKTKAGKIVIGVVVTATVVTALAVFLGVWLGLRLRNDRQAQVSSGPTQTSCPSQPPPCTTTANDTTQAFIGGTSFALQTTSNDTRIYYQLADGSLHVRSGVGPVTAGGRYSDALLVAPGIARINTPLAAISWSPDNFEQIRFYYVATDNQIHEICYPLVGAPFVGALDGQRYFAAPNSRLLYAVCNYPDHPRLGFQSAVSPASITEAFYTPQTGWNAAILT